MISTKNINALPLTKENILKFITEEDIFRKYIKHNFKIGEIFSAEYRVDNKPSFGIYYNQYKNKLMFNDLGKTKESGDCFKYVRLANNNCTYMQALSVINKDFKLGLGGGIYNKDINSTIVNKIEYQRNRKQIDILKQDFTEIDRQYWSSYSISIETLMKYNVFSCKCFSIDGKLVRYYTDNYPIYAYYFPRTNNYKLYIPNEKSAYKWITNANNDWDIQGYDQLPKNGDLLYITKSLKDVMCLYELGYNAVATHGESQYFNPDFIRHLNGRFKRLILFYDNDEAGKIFGSKIGLKFNLEQFYIPDEYYLKEDVKDISDFIKKYGKEEARRIMGI